MHFLGSCDILSKVRFMRTKSAVWDLTAINSSFSPSPFYPLHPSYPTLPLLSSPLFIPLPSHTLPFPPPSNPPLSLSPSIFYTLLLKIQLKKISLRFLWIKGNFGNCWMHLEKSLFCVHFFNFKQPILNPKSNPICEKYQNCKTGFLILTKSSDCSYVQEHL